ncbi:very long-chain acyl-CoA synthetase-like [Acanthaster planci]|uniref:Very long-chain fatty acid transport protein n=1 Tax=Acanthaster planci TaxID=133434 RepID=A0A8B8A4F0_ACAPL|nr:very long-chain acyl-CoA synthetase-like [Acanthaster planci]XP_022110799.1 very long-chain acyl-CoA synthetase-like [Acanthaster planci]XP_022110800.1 very long-chain acyl-CoA synthetase-like [Acanthaster planci]XP_022110801.1 very long-chain acyl-CoA synthetase-like [Acanthaster planci]XP_022110802.1 very long-chain acyl-CoA synthetase-like [Acanthaster planci]
MGLLLQLLGGVLGGVSALAVLFKLTYPTFFHDLSQFLLIVRKVVTPTEKLLEKGILQVDVFESHAKRNPEKVLVLYKDEKHTYSDIDHAANKMANYLQKTDAVKVRDIVGIFMHNEPAYISTVIALLKLGTTGAHLNISLRGDALINCIRVGKIKTIICGGDAELVAAIQEILTTLEAEDIKVFMMQEPEGQTLPNGFLPVDLASPLASTEAIPRDVRKGILPSESAFYFYTSGTTGMPKAARMTQKRVMVGGSLLQMFNLSSSDVMYIPLPLFHSAGMVIGVGNVITAGCTMVIRNKFSASHFWEDVRRYNVTVIQYIGEICRYLLAQPKGDSDMERNHSVWLAIGNGLSTDIWTDFQDRFCIAQIGEFFASSEGNRGFMNTDGTVGAVGAYSPLTKLLLNDVEIIECDWETAQPIRGPDGKCIILPKGKTGLMVSKISKAAEFEGYVAGKEADEKKIIRNVRVMGDAYFNSGDLMMIDSKNYVFFKDRLGDTFRWKGENVASSEVAAILTDLPNIKEAIVYGVRIPGYDGRAGMAAIVLQDGTETLEWKEVYAEVANRLPTYARPKFIRVKDQMETTQTHKYRKLDLVKEAFDPESCGTDKLFFMDESQKSYVPLGKDLHCQILNKDVRI